jgi:anti-sigma regulatory factor (Ser/Thr protein kinase)
MDRAFSRSFWIQGSDFGDAGKASTEIKTILKQLGVDSSVVRRVAITSYEAEMNVVMYARRANLQFEVTPNRITIVVDDEGPGIPDIQLAMKEGFSTATDEMREMGFGAGLGLPNIKRNCDDLKIESKVGKGTRLEITININ